jgi:hypothetical protein
VAAAAGHPVFESCIFGKTSILEKMGFPIIVIVGDEWHSALSGTQAFTN